MADDEPPLIKITADGKMMVPIESVDMADTLRRAVYNISQFDYVTFERWLMDRPDQVRRLARAYPPDRIYRVGDDGPPARLTYAIVLSYTKSPDPPGVLVRLISPITATAEVVLPPETLIDVTDAIRANFGVISP